MTDSQRSLKLVSLSTLPSSTRSSPSSKRAHTSASPPPSPPQVRLLEEPALPLPQPPDLADAEEGVVRREIHENKSAVDFLLRKLEHVDPWHALAMQRELHAYLLYHVGRVTPLLILALANT